MGAEKHPEWLMYWAVMSCFTALEVFGDVLISWLPFYYEAKIAFILWLVLPKWRGAIHIYRKVLNPIIEKYGKQIDQHLDDFHVHATRKASEVGGLALDGLQKHSLSLLAAGQQAITKVQQQSEQQAK